MRTIFSRPLLLSATMLAAIFSVACKNNDKPEEQKEVIIEDNEVKYDKNIEKDAQFLVEAAEINLMEIKLGELAQAKGMMADTKDMGKMMTDDHAKAFSDLKEIAAQKTITIPTTMTDNGEDIYKDLSEKSGADFDKKYADMMVEGHGQAIAKFEQAVKDGHDLDIRTWATVMLPILRGHLDLAIAYQKKCEKI